MATHQLNYATHQLENLQLLSEETALNFQYWNVSSCSTLFHGQNWSFQQDSARTHKALNNPAVAGDKCSRLHLHSDWPSASPDLNPLDYKLWSKASADGLQVETSQYWKFKAISLEDFPVDVLHNSIDGWPQRFKDCVCVLKVANLNNYLQFWFKMHPCSSCY